MIFRSDDGTNIFYESFRSSKPIGSVLIVHGMGEHSGRYEELVGEFSGLGLDVHLMDLRGHGRSFGTRGHFQSMEEIHHDLDGWISHLVSSGTLKETVPCFLLGHSLGGLIVLSYLDHYKEKALYPNLAGVILSAPAIEIRTNLFQALQTQIAGKIPQFLRSMQLPTGIRSEQLTHDLGERKIFDADPLVHSWITPSAFLAMDKASREVRRRSDQLPCDALFLIPGKDSVINPDATKQFAERMKDKRVEGVEIKIYHGFFHEPFHETKRQRPILETKKWILQCIAKKLPLKRTKKTKLGLSKSSKPGATVKANLH